MDESVVVSVAQWILLSSIITIIFVKIRLNICPRGRRNIDRPSTVRPMLEQSVSYPWKEEEKDHVW
jgi:hypothetical protein